jgi:uncharacterized protein (TIGR00730 family)
VAKAASLAGGHVTGIIPNFLRHLEPPLKISSEILFTETMSERKGLMFDMADGFAVLPGGLGTLDEFSEVHTAAQLGLMVKPIVLVNANDYFAPLVTLVDHFVAEGFAGERVKSLFHVAPTVEDALDIFVADFAATHPGAPSR